MFSKLACTLAVAGAASIASLGNVLFTDDFSSGTDDAWVRANALAPLGGTTFDASGGEYTMTSNAVLPPLPFYVGDGASLAASDDRSFRNCNIGFTVRVNNADTNVQLAARGNLDTPGAGYIAFNYQRELGIFINVIPDDGAPTGSPPIAEAPYQFDVGRDYAVLVTMHGEHLTMKVWPADEREPRKPQLAVNESRFQQRTGVAFIMYNQPTFQPGGSGGQLSATFDNVSITRGGNN